MKVSPAERSSIKAHVAEVMTYPVKSLSGVLRESVAITDNGLDGDRMFTLARKAEMGSVAAALPCVSIHNSHK